MKKLLFKIPPFVATVIVMGLVAYLTLFPDPVPAMPLMMFPYADKVVHFLMFFAVSACWLFDSGRVMRGAMVVSIAVSTLYGGLIELLQMWMGMGRSADWFDFVADFFGVVAGVAVCHRLLFKKF